MVKLQGPGQKSAGPYRDGIEIGKGEESEKKGEVGERSHW